MVSDVRQYNFSGGEIAPLLHHRSDLKAYGTALRTCKNFVPSKHGALVSRAGTKIVRRVEAPHRLAKFVVSSDESWVLGFAAFVGQPSIQVRFFSNGQAQLSTGGLATNYLNGTTLRALSALLDGANLERIRLAQSGLTAVVTQRGQEPRELRKLTGFPNVQWSMDPIGFDLEPFPGPEPYAVDPIPTGGDDNTPAREWVFYTSAILRRPDGTKYETAAREVKGTILFGNPPANPTRPRDGATFPPDRNPIPFLLLVYPHKPFELDFSFAQDAAWTKPDEYYATVIYRGRGALVGRVGMVLRRPEWSAGAGARRVTETGGRTSGNSPGRFIDYGADPDFGNPPPLGHNPFKIFQPNGTTLLRTEYPTAVEYFDGRQVYGGTEQRPGWIGFSAVDRFRDFDERVFLVDKGAATVVLATQARQEIRSMLSVERLLVFTDHGVWALGDTPITGAGINPFRSMSSVGASWVQPVSIPGGILYATRQGNSVRNLLYSEERQGYDSADMTFFAQHLFEGKKVKDWAFSAVPWGVLWVVLDDGTLLSFTYAPDLGIIGWARHETQGRVNWIAVAPEGDEDVLYLSTTRELGGSTRHFVERMETRVVDDVEDAVCLDCAVEFPYPGGATGPFTQLTGLGHLAGGDVWAVADGNVIGPLDVPVSGVVDLPEPAAKVVIGLRYECVAETLDVAGDKFVGKRVVRTLIDVERTRGFEVGVNEDTFEEWNPRKPEHDWDAVPLFTGQVPRYLKGKWSESGRVLIRQRLPLPLTITGITREIEGGSR